LEGKISSSPVAKWENLGEIYEKFVDKQRLIVNIRNTRKEIQQTQSIIQLDELKCRRRVLRRLGYISESDVIEMKGRVACEISAGDELLLTEMIFQGAFNELTVEQTVALLSCFTWQEKVMPIVQVIVKRQGDSPRGTGPALPAYAGAGTKNRQGQSRKQAQY
jgi:ATP-dependent RNA helicase DOB1